MPNTTLVDVNQIPFGTSTNPFYTGGGSVPANDPSAGGNISLISNGSASGSVYPGIYGGSYVFAVQGTFGGATVALVALGPDGSTYMTLASKTVADTTGGTGVGLPQGATVQGTITGGSPSAIYATLSRIP